MKHRSFTTAKKQHEFPIDTKWSFLNCKTSNDKFSWFNIKASYCKAFDASLRKKSFQTCHICHVMHQKLIANKVVSRVTLTSHHKILIKNMEHQSLLINMASPLFAEYQLFVKWQLLVTLQPTLSSEIASNSNRLQEISRLRNAGQL